MNVRDVNEPPLLVVPANRTFYFVDSTFPNVPFFTFEVCSFPHPFPCFPVQCCLLVFVSVSACFDPFSKLCIVRACACLVIRVLPSRVLSLVQSICQNFLDTGEQCGFSLSSLLSLTFWCVFPRPLSVVRVHRGERVQWCPTAQSAECATKGHRQCRSKHRLVRPDDRFVF